MNKIMRYLVSAILILTVGLLVMLPVPVFAISDPDSPPQVSAVYVYEDLLEDGDIGILIDYYLDYDFTAPITGTPVPSQTVTEAFLAAFIDIGGVTQLKSVAPYTFIRSGYGRGLVWIYFTADEVATYHITSTNQTSYSIWLMGNPTLSWTSDNTTPCDPPKVISGIDYWQTTGDPAVLLALRVLYYADQLELIWSLDMVGVTTMGSRLTSAGESYFENVIPNLRTMAPAAFSVSEVGPTVEVLDYSTSFGAIATSTILVGSPVTLAGGVNNLNPTGAGTITFTLNGGTSGNVTGATVSGSPVNLVAGTNTVTITGAGAIVTTVNLQDTTTAQTDIVVGTGFDLTTVATAFGMSRWFFSSLVWLIMSVLICAAVYRGTSREGFGDMGAGTGKVVLLIFDICIIGGVLLGLLKPIVAVGMFLIFGAFTGYVLFFRGANV